jgi:hypothetical protein
MVHHSGLQKFWKVIRCDGDVLSLGISPHPPVLVHVMEYCVREIYIYIYRRKFFEIRSASKFQDIYNFEEFLNSTYMYIYIYIYIYIYTIISKKLNSMV